MAVRLAFKDLALSLFPHLLTAAKEQEQEHRQILILTATSGDTGKAALEGFKDVPGTNIMVFYPSQGVSPMQKDSRCRSRKGKTSKFPLFTVTSTMPRAS
jgi:threonine synthase